MTAVETAVDDYPDYDLVVVGHSLGGAIATFAATQLRNAGYTASLVRSFFLLSPFPFRKELFNHLASEISFEHANANALATVYIWRTTNWRQCTILVHQ